MARFKPVDMSPRFLPVVLERQIQPGTFEHALHVLIDTEFDLAALAVRYINDDTGAPTVHQCRTTGYTATLMKYIGFSPKMPMGSRLSRTKSD
jgi:hypothetical protein